VVKHGGQTLRSGRDYTVSYENNVEIGEATATITGTGAYSGTASIGFQIGAPDASTLQTELASAQGALDGVVPSDDKGATDIYGNTLAAGAKWMPSDAYNSLQQAIEQAQEVLSKQTATKSEVAAAVRALAKAMSAVYTAEGSQSSEGGEGGSGSGGSGSGSVSGGGTSGGGSTAPAATTVKAGKSYVVGSGAKAAYYKVKKVATKKAAGMVWYAKPKSPKKVKKLSIPATVKIKGLTYNVVGIEAKALSKCTKLTKATIGSKVVTIGKNAFKGAKKLKTLTIGAKVKAVGKTAFKGCKKLKKVTVKSAKLTKTSCKNLVKGTKITKVVLKGSAKKAKVKKKYKKYFPKKNAGKKLKIA